MTDDVVADAMSNLAERVASLESREADEVIERTDEGASVSVDITRGTGTRDQEKWTVKGKGSTAEGALANLLEDLEAVVGDLDPDEPLAEQVRGFQPGEDGDD